MKIPDELKGKEVKKFEECGVYIGDCGRNGWYYSKEIDSFYTQNFTPDMIAKYFEGWASEATQFGMSYYSGSLIGGFRVEQFQPQPKTLSDFVDACLNSGITLRYRK